MLINSTATAANSPATEVAAAGRWPTDRLRGRQVISPAPSPAADGWRHAWSCDFKRRAALAKLTIALGLSSLAGCHLTPPEDVARQTIKAQAIKAKQQLAALGTIETQGGELHGQDTHGRPVWKLSAKKIMVNAGADPLQPRHAMLIEARAVLYRTGKPESNFRAQKIEFFDTPQGVRMVMTGGVQAQTSGPWTGKRGPVSMQCPRAEVNVKTRRLIATQAQLTQAQTHVAARALTADTGLYVAQLHGDVKATAPEGVVTADEALWKWHEGQAQASGHVRATHANTTLTGAKLAADTNIKQGVLTGVVHVTAPQGQAQADAVHYDWASDALSARGGVTLIKDNATLKAARIDTDKELNHATVPGAVTLRRGDLTLVAGHATLSDKMTHAVAGGGVTVDGPNLKVRAFQVELADIDAKGQQIGHLTATGEARLERGDQLITAPHVEASQLDLKSKAAGQVVARGGVFARNPQGDVRAAQVAWSHGQIIGTGDVTLHKAGNELSGARLQTDDQFQTATLSGNVSGHLANNVTVAGGKVVWRRLPLPGLIQARQQVTARRDTLHLSADQMDATADGAQATLKGHVVVTSDNGTVIRAPLARYVKKDGIKGKIYAEDGVAFHDPQHKLQGNGKSLVYDVATKEVSLNNGTTSGDAGSFKHKITF